MVQLKLFKHWGWGARGIGCLCSSTTLATFLLSGVGYLTEAKEGKRSLWELITRGRPSRWESYGRQNSSSCSREKARQLVMSTHSQEAGTQLPSSVPPWDANPWDSAIHIQGGSPELHLCRTTLIDMFRDMCLGDSKGDEPLHALWAQSYSWTTDRSGCVQKHWWRYSVVLFD